MNHSYVRQAPFHILNVPTAAVTCYEPLVVPPGPGGDVFSWGAAEETQRTQYSLITADRDDEPEPGEFSPEVALLVRRPDDKRDVAVLSFLLPHLKRRSFEDVSVHHCDGADEAPFEWEV